MEKKIFRSIITVAFCVLVISTLFIMQVLYTHVEKNIDNLDDYNDIKTKNIYPIIEQTR